MDCCYLPYRADFWTRGLRAYEIQLHELDSLPVWHGIYFLCIREGVFYVGQSQARDDGIKGRIWEHWQHSNKTFHYVILLSMQRDKNRIDHWEKAAIRAFNPDGNKKHRDPYLPPQNDILGIPKFMASMNVEQINQIVRIGINSYYDQAKAEFGEPYRSLDNISLPTSSRH